jgi:ribose-phosphate pyrophosphokinase
MISYTINNIATHVRQWKFPDTCIGVDINIGSMEPVTSRFDIYVSCIFGDEFTINDNVFALGLTMDALKHYYPCSDFHLLMPYTPYGRQDRACSPGEAFSLRFVGKVINGIGFTTVTVLDPHSGVVDACIDNLQVVNQFDIFSKIYTSFREVYIVAPDQGATKKCEDFAKRVGAAGVITCSKVREMSTGKILGLKLLDEVPKSAYLLVLDDICDGGRTFIEVAQAITAVSEPLTLDLAVTHGLFTKGAGVVADFYDTIYTTDSFISDKNHDKVEVNLLTNI